MSLNNEEYAKLCHLYDQMSEITNRGGSAATAVAPAYRYLAVLLKGSATSIADEMVRRGIDDQYIKNQNAGSIASQPEDKVYAKHLETGMRIRFEGKPQTVEWARPLINRASRICVRFDNDTTEYFDADDVLDLV